MSTLTEVRDALKTTIDGAAIPGFSVYTTVPETVKIPCGIIEPDAEVQSDFGGGMTVNFDLVVLVSRVDSMRGQDELDKYVTMHGTYSIPKRIRENSNLGLADTDSIVKSMNNYGAKYNVGGIDYVGAVLKTFVITEGA